MNNHIQKRSPLPPLFIFLSGILLLLFGLMFSLSAQPALANPSNQGYPVDTPTVTVTSTNTAVATATFTATATRAGTLPPPGVTGTPTVLVPVTGADLTLPPGQEGVGLWIALWLVGLLLIGYGLRSKLGKQ